LIRRIIVIGVLLVAILGVGLWWTHFHRSPAEEVFAAERRVTLWSSTAMVREPLATLGYGERLEVVSRLGDNLEVRTGQGVVGWVDSRQLLDAALWNRVTKLNEQARGMPAQAFGHTKVVSNLRIEPGREGQRIIQLGRYVPLDVLAREVVEVPVDTKAEDAEEETSAKKEDWVLVRAQVKDLGELSGWMLGRFIELDMPSPLPDYATAAGMHVVGWFELDRVPDAGGTMRPQYLVIGQRGGEGQPCDFSLLRVYTWGARRKRYETAFVESGVCGKLPVRVEPAEHPGGDATFRFTAAGDNGDQPLEYRMHQTIVRRIRSGEKPRAHKPHH
jgi:hypothetical protein